jgi:hypothetical protein
MCNLDGAEQLEKRHDREHANKHPARQHEKMGREDSHRPEPSNLIGVGIEVRETDIGDHGRSGAAHVAPSRGDCDRCAHKGGNFHPGAFGAGAQQEARVLAERMRLEELQPSTERKNFLPCNWRARCASGCRGGSEIIGRKPRREKEDQAQKQRRCLPSPFGARRSSRQHDYGSDRDVSRRGKNEADGRRQQPGNEQDEKGDAQSDIAPPAVRCA